MSFGSTNAGMTGIQFQNTSVTFSLQSTPDFADYPYRGTYANSGITAQAYAEVVYSGTQASSGYYAPFCQTYNGGVYLYAKSNVGTQTIPTIAVGTASFSLTMDNTPTSGSNNPVSSGGVYTAITNLGVNVAYSSEGVNSQTIWYGGYSTTKFISVTKFNMGITTFICAPNTKVAYKVTNQTNTATFILPAGWFYFVTDNTSYYGNVVRINLTYAPTAGGTATVSSNVTNSNAYQFEFAIDC